MNLPRLKLFLRNTVKSSIRPGKSLMSKYSGTGVKHRSDEAQSRNPALDCDESVQSMLRTSATILALDLDAALLLRDRGCLTQNSVQPEGLGYNC